MALDNAIALILARITPGFLAALAYLLIYAIALKTFTSVVFKKITVSKTYVTLTKRDLVFILLFLSLFFNGFSLFLSSGMLERGAFVTVFDIISRFLVAGLAFGASYFAVKSEVFEAFA